MKYTGRIVLASISLSLISMWHLMNYINEPRDYIGYVLINGNIIYEIVYILIVFLISWLFGKQYDKAKFFAEKDVLTDVYNRRFILRIFPKLLAMVDRKRERLSLLIIDVNDFKKINDTYGHAIGDKVLQRISLILKATTRQSDIVARWGGDEFIIVAPFTDKSASLSMIKRIESELNELSTKELNIEISTSIGIAVYPNNGNDLDDLIKGADQKMYRFKAKNKNN